MKYRIFLMVLLTCFIGAEVYAQCSPPPTCILNPGIDNSTAGWGNPIGTSLPNWYVLSGTPTLEQGTGGSSGFGLTSGSGIFACHNFQAGRTYKICAVGYNTNWQNGNIIIEAHDGGTNSYIIGNINFHKYAHPPIHLPFVTFTASQNFTQLRFYTNSPGYSIVIDDVGIIEVPTVTVTPTTITPCQSATITLSSGNPLVVSWSPPDGLSSTSGTTVTASPCKTTTYTATYYSGNCPVYSCYNNTVQVTVNVQSNVGTITNNSSSACGGPIDLQYTGTPCPGSTYHWFGPNNYTIPLYTGGPNFYMPTSIPDPSSYMLVITSPQGCKDTLYEPVIQNCCSVVADFDIIDCNPVRFANQTVDGNGNPVIQQGQWHWDFGNGNTSTIRNPSELYASYAPGDVVEVCLTAIASDGLSTCCDKICKEFEVCDWGCDPKAAFDWKIINPVSGVVQLIDKSVGAGTATGWTWTINGVPYGNNPFDANPVVYLGPGQHNICLNVDYGGCTEQWCEIIVIP